MVNTRWKHDGSDRLDANTVRKDNPEGCKLKADLEYPKELHDLHNDYSLAPEKIEIKKSILSNYCKFIKLYVSV